MPSQEVTVECQENSNTKSDRCPQENIDVPSIVGEDIFVNVEDALSVEGEDILEKAECCKLLVRNEAEGPDGDSKEGFNLEMFNVISFAVARSTLGMILRKTIEKVRAKEEMKEMVLDLVDDVVGGCRMYDMDRMSRELRWIWNKDQATQKKIVRLADSMERKHLVEQRKVKAEGKRREFLDEWRKSLEVEMVDKQMKREGPCSSDEITSRRNGLRDRKRRRSGKYRYKWFDIPKNIKL